MMKPSELGEYKQTSLVTSFRPACGMFNHDKEQKYVDKDETPPLFENEELFETDRFPQENDIICHGSVNNTSAC